jgi:hypothetical protein
MERALSLRSFKNRNDEKIDKISVQVNNKLEINSKKWHNIICKGGEKYG